jgi:hypothetical protein
VPHLQGLGTRSPQLCRRATYLVRTAFVVVLLFDIFFAGSVLFKLVTVGIRGAGGWIVEISGPRPRLEFCFAVIFQSLVTLALWRVQLKLASRTVTAHVVNKTLNEVDEILATTAPGNRKELLRDLAAQLTVNLLDGEPHLMEFTLRRSGIKKGVSAVMAWDTAITTVRVFANGPVPGELKQSLRKVVSNLRG